MADLSLVFRVLGKDDASVVLRQVGDESNKAGDRLDNFSTRATAANATLRAALGGPGGIALAATAAAGALSPLVGLVGLLPALGAAAGFGVAALAVGTRGFGEALSNLGDAEKFNASLEKLAPNAAATAVAVRDLGPAFSSIQVGTQNALFAGLATQVTAIGVAFGPTLSAGLAGVAASFNAMALGVTAFLTESATVSATAMLFENVRLTVANLALSVQPLLQAFRDLSVVGSEFLPGFAQGFANAALRFAEFTAAARESGAIKEFIQSGIDALGDLVVVLSAVVQGLTGSLGPFSLASGALNLLANNATALTVVTQVALPVFLAYRLAVLAAGIAQGVMAASTVVATTARALFTTTTIAATTAEGVATTVTRASTVSRIAGTFATVASTVAMGAARLATVAYTVAQVALNVALRANPIGLVITALVALVVGIVAAFRNSETFRSIVVQAFTAVLAAGRSLATFITTTVPQAFAKAKDGAATAVGALIALVAGIPGRITGALGNLGSLLANAGRQLIEGLIGGITSKLDGLRSIMSSVASTIGGFLPGSPIKTGPLTSWNNGGAGLRLMGLLEGGIASGLPGVNSALNSGLSGLDASVSATAGADLSGMGGGLGGKLDRIEAAILNDARRMQLKDRQMAGV